MLVVRRDRIHILTAHEDDDTTTWLHIVQGDGAHLGEETDLGSGAAGRAAAARIDASSRSKL